MAKNFLYFIIDSLNYKHVKESSIELMPYLSELKKKGVSCENMYSQAPYTEAAVMNLYCGQDVLQNGGYLFRFKNAPKTIFEVMSEHGYKTYYNSYQPQCHPSSVRRGITDLYYNVGYDLNALWSYRLSHYSELLKNGKLTEEDYLTLIEIFDDNFKEWIRFTNDVLNDDKSVEMIRNNDADFIAQSVLKDVQSQYSEYQKAPKKYINSVLNEGQSHCLFNIKMYVQHNKTKNREVVRYVRTEFKPVFNRIKRMNRKLNLKNAKGVFKGPIHKFGKFVCHPGKLTLKDFLKSIYLSVNEIFDLDLFQRIDEDCDWFKNAPSARTHIDHFINWTRNQNKDQPFFACIHIDDIHNPEEFFTYDTSDIELLRKEKEQAERLLDQIPDNYYGSLTHDLSLRYIDNVIKYLYDSLSTEKLLEDTCIVICADHGFSFSGNPLRDSFVINLFLENYNIPCVITGAGYEGTVINQICQSKDIPATLCELAFGEIPTEFSGYSVIRDKYYSYGSIEYCGGGCPDLSRRELKLASFNEDLFVGCLTKIDDTFSNDSITEIYDLQNDPQQLQNLVGQMRNDKRLTPYLSLIKQRIDEITKSNPNKTQNEK